MDLKKLRDIGLNKNEALIYSTLIRLGSSTAGILIKKTEFHRNIVYDNLEKLIDKGLVTYIIEGKKKIFQISNPEMLDDYLEKEQDKLNQKKKIAEQVKIEIKKSIKNRPEVQEATIYRGIKGLKVIMKDTLDEGKDYCAFGAPHESLDIMGETFWNNYNVKRKEMKIKTRMIFNLELKKWSKQIDNKFTDVRFLPKEFDPLSETIVYGDKTAIIVWTEKPIATLIKDRNLADSYRKHFQFLWRQAKK